MYTIELHRKQRLLSRLALAFCLIVALFTLVIFILLPGIKPGKIVALLSVVGFGAISRLSLNPDRFHASAIAMVVLTMAAGFAGSLTNGGLEGYIAPILITSPIAAALFLGARETLFSAIAVVLAYAVLLLIEPYGVIQPEPYPEDVTSIAALVLLATATAFCAAGLGYFAKDSKEKIESLTKVQNKLLETAKDLHHSAHHDPLTGIANRQSLQKFVEATLYAHSTENDQVCLIHIDLDHFKEVNDTYGHPVGDGVLRKAAERMTDQCGEDDLVARIGGDEFVIVTTKSSCSPSEAIQTRCETLIEQLSRPIFVNGIECRIGASIGYVISDRACSSTDALITNADMALYESKRSGRGVAHLFTGDMRENVEFQRSRVSDFKTAFDEDRIFCALQPQICFETGAILSMEALGRIRTKTGATMMPAEYLDTMEEIGLIDAFDHRVMQKALDALVAVRAQGFSIPSVAVNASSKSLRSDDYASVMTQELAARGLSPDCIVVEVLESILIEDRDDLAAKTIEALCEAGIKTVIDDFGSGHASMWALLELKLDGIKIDRSLITNIECDRSRTVVEAVLKLSKGLNLTAVVEGIETPHQYAALKALGCDAAQGFGICRPLELDALQAWLDQFGGSGVANLQSQIRRANLG